MGRRIHFSTKSPGGDRIYPVTEGDVRVVLGRLPGDVCARLKAVHFNDCGWRRKTLGYVRRRGREITLCAIPPRISFRRYLARGQSPDEFGARRGAPWPELAVRRLMLYDVLLHELGHLQVVHAGTKNPRRRYAAEPRAQEFADTWRWTLWSEPFNHPDPAHSPPSDAELQNAPLPD